MQRSPGTIPAWSVHPLHAAGLFGAFALYLGAMLSDFAYWHTQQVQWTNFASWFIAGGLVFAGVALACSLWAPLRHPRRGATAWLYPALLILSWLLGLWNALVHARDAWGSMPEGLVLSVVVVLLHLAAACLCYLRARSGGQP